MEHIRIATYDIDAGALGSLAELAHGGLLRTYEDQPGFLRHSLFPLQGPTFLSLTVWATADEADRAIVVAEDWVRGNDSGPVNFGPKPIRRHDPIDHLPAAI